MKPSCRAALLLGFASFIECASANAQAGKQLPATRHFRYEMIETINKSAKKGYRMDFDLLAHDNVIEAFILAAEETVDGKVWEPVTAPTEACRIAMHAPPGGLARVTLWPVSSGSHAALGPAFLDQCAPDAVFFPLTDILNVVIIPVSPRFGVSALKKVGDKARFAGFVAEFNRPSEKMKETSHGGVTVLVSRRRNRVIIDWLPAVADLNLEHQGSEGQVVNLKGTERWGFRVEVEEISRALVRAHTTYDDLALIMATPGVTQNNVPPLKISRVVDIGPR